MTGRDDELEPFFEAGRGEGRLSTDFMARLQADAEAHRPAPKVVPLRRRAPGGIWAGGGLLAAGVAGVAIGLAAPETLSGIFQVDDTAWELAQFLPAADPASLWGEVQ